jgi:predicted ATPase/DNA-binding winged helix-turn-helix (wHTH) protein
VEITAPGRPVFEKRSRLAVSGHMEVPARSNLVYAAGSSELDPTRRELRSGGRAVPIGTRAFEIMQALAQSSGELVTKDDLMAHIWPGAIVGENTIHVHISAIRKALGPDRAMLKTASGRGYRLHGSWKARQDNTRPAPPPVRSHAEADRGNLPAATSDLIGRDAVVRRARDLISAYRVVTLVGPGGIGKTRLALEIAGLVSPGFSGGVWLIELASLSDASLVTAAIATALSLHVGGNDISPEALARAIGDRKFLLLIDNCEHVIDTAAAVVDAVVRLCPAASILATSRERLRVAGECTYHVPALGVSPLELPGRDSVEPGQDQFLEASAIQLFIARMTAWRQDLEYRHQLSAIAAICRRLDGIPLAIEFAAARAGTLGIDQVLARLDDRFTLLTSGRRTALPKNQTLRATLDWSHELLSGPEQLLLRRLAIFTAAFSLEAANGVVGRSDVVVSEIEAGVANLIEKSLVTADVAGAEAHYRLLETTRAYALARLADSGELEQLARLHAEYYRGLLETGLSKQEAGPVRAANLGNARAALEWCFGPRGDSEIGIGLAAAFAPVFHETSMIAERHRWSERAILALDDSTRGGPEEMRLQASFGGTSMHMHGQTDAAHVALTRSLAIAEQRGDVPYQVGALCQLSTFHARLGHFKTMLLYDQRSQAVAETVDDAETQAVAQSILGRSLHFLGDHRGARAALEASLQHWSRSQQSREIDLGLDHRIVVGIGLSRTLWLQGYPVQAMERVRQNLKDAESRNHPASLGLALAWALGTFLWAGDLESVEEHAGRLVSHATSHSLRPYLTVARGYQGALAIRRDDAEGGVASLQTCLTELHTARYGIFNTEFNFSLVQGLVAIERPDEGMILADETIRLLDANGEVSYMPEALRVKGGIVLAMPRPDADAAEGLFRQSLELSRHQGARAWELRTAVDLAALLVARGSPDRARTLLLPVFEQFEEGLDTADPRAAARLLETLR